MKTLTTCSALLAACLMVSCGEGSTFINDRPISDGATFVTVQAISAAAVDRVVIRAQSQTTSAVSEQTLNYVKTSGVFSGYVVLAPDNYNITALAFVGGLGDGGVARPDAGVGTLIGQGTGVIAVQPGTTSALSLDIRDVTTGRPQGDIPPIITQLSASKVRVSPTELVQLTAQAVDLDGDAITFLWRDDCGGSFSASTQGSTNWSRTTSGACNLSISAQAHGVTTSKSLNLNVVTQADGTVGIGGQFIARPEFYYVEAYATWDGGSSSSTFYRYSSQPGWSVPQTAQISLYPSASSASADGGIVSFSMVSTCAGTFTPMFYAWDWQPQFVVLAEGTTRACKLTGSLVNQTYPELRDDFSFGIELR